MPTRIASLPAVAGLERVASEEPAFLGTFGDIVQNLGWDQARADALASLISHESGFKPDALNAFTKNHVGLIQFGPEIRSEWKISKEAMLDMSATEQLEYVEKFFRRAAQIGKTPVETLPARDLAVAGFMPALLGKDDSYVAASADGSQGFYKDSYKNRKVYEQNPMDTNEDGLLTLGEIRAHVNGMLEGAEGKTRVPVPASSGLPAGGKTSEKSGWVLGAAAIAGLALLFGRRR